MIRFRSDCDVDPRDPKSPRDLVELIHLLAGRGPFPKPKETTDRTEVDPVTALARRLEKVAPRATSRDSLSYEQLNELLLLADESRISRAFFAFFFSPEVVKDRKDLSVLPTVTREQLKAGITRFRGFAMLRFGNFRYAFQRLREAASLDELHERLHPWAREKDELEKSFKSRREPISDLQGAELARDETSLIGYIVGARLEEALRATLPAELRREAEEFARKIESARKRAERNTVAYLSSDYMDVYFATSMRYGWEFEETYDFIRELFKSSEQLRSLELRWFDPTQSYSAAVLDKSLLEALMLKRARCTVYLAQEADTLGKDSELAATLAQGKPVIAYVRALDGEALRAYCDGLRLSWVRYYLKRVLTVRAEDFFNARNLEAVATKLNQLGRRLCSDEIEARAQSIAAAAEELCPSPAGALLGDSEPKAREELLKREPDAPEIMAALDAVSFDRRARTIAQQHPLAMQVNLDTGVANGVLVVREARQCAKLLYSLLVNDLEFEIAEKLEKIPASGEEFRVGTVLKERISEGAFRYVTYDTLLTNSFWNFYLSEG